ncbi:MAG: HAMP domain-containing protein [Streptosporangiales bacterium]|nr:HAMP domain-containing protein [Streptosporangiales bacterium]
MRRRLALLVAATASLVLVAFLVPLALLVRNVAADRAINAATLEAQSLAAVVATGSRDTLDAAVDQVNASAHYPVTVFLGDGRVLGTQAERTPAVRLAERGRSVTAETADGGREILVTVQGGAMGSAVIRTYVAPAQLVAGVGPAWLALGLLGLILLGLGLLVADRLARSFVRPVAELSSVSNRLAHGDLDARAAAAGPPEIQDVAVALNGLAERIRGLLTAERERVADLSHRLRTPLTALRLDVEALRDPAERERVGEGLDAVQRAVGQAIADARRPDATATADAAAVVRDRAAFWAVLAEDTDRAMSVEVPGGPLPVAVSRGDLEAAVDALLGNVFAHTPDGVGLAVRLTAAGGGALLVVSDEGPGFDGPDVLRRGASGAGSTGLGLDIARRAAEASGGELTLADSPSGGAEVRLRVGAAPRSP